MRRAPSSISPDLGRAARSASRWSQMGPRAPFQREWIYGRGGASVSGTLPRPQTRARGVAATCKIKREAPHPALMYDSQCVRAREPGVAARPDRPGRRPRLPSGGARARGRRLLEAS